MSGLWGLSPWFRASTVSTWGVGEAGSSGIHIQGIAKSLADLQAEGGGEPGVVGRSRRGRRARKVRRPSSQTLEAQMTNLEPLCQKAQGV